MAATGTIDQRPARADAQRNRERIVAAGRDAFAELGGDARMEDIARRAGVGVGTVYRHFATKEALMAELLAGKWRQMAQHVEEQLASDAGPWDTFAGALRRNAEMMAADAAVRHAVMHAAASEVFEEAADAKVDLLSATREMIERGQSAGVIRADLTVEDIPLVMCGVSAAMDNAAAGQGGWRRHLEIVLDGMRA